MRPVSSIYSHPGVHSARSSSVASIMPPPNLSRSSRANSQLSIASVNLHKAPYSLISGESVAWEKSAVCVDRPSSVEPPCVSGITHENVQYTTPHTYPLYSDTYESCRDDNDVELLHENRAHNNLGRFLINGRLQPVAIKSGSLNLNRDYRGGHSQNGTSNSVKSPELETTLTEGENTIEPSQHKSPRVGAHNNLLLCYVKN